MKTKINYNGLQDDGKTAVVYARYSSHNQTEQSIEGQLAAAKAYADAKGYTIIHEYIDRAMTGRTDNRDAFQQMLNDCAKRKFQVIIVWKVDRFGRNREEITFNKYRAKKNGVRVEYVAESLPDTAEAVILESVLEGMAEYYSLQLSQNIKRGYLENAKKCKYAGGRVPFGYKLDEEKHFIPDPSTAPVVCSIFRAYADGATVTEIINDLNAKGIKTSQKEPFTKNSLGTLLKNEKYIGIYDFKNGTVRIEDGVPALIDKDTFYRVQEMLKINRRAPAQTWNRADYLLTDKLFCGHCGGAMVGFSGYSKHHVKYHYYQCVNHTRAKSCDRKAVKQEVIEEIVLEKTKQIISDDAVLEFIAEKTWQYYLTLDNTQKEINAMKAKRDETDRAITNLMHAIEAGLPMNDITRKRINELNEQYEAQTAALKSMELKASLDITKNTILYFLKQFQKLDFSNRECQRRIIKVFVNSIYVFDDDMLITYNFGGKSEIVSFEKITQIRASSGFVYCAPCSTNGVLDKPYYLKDGFVITVWL